MSSNFQTRKKPNKQGNFFGKTFSLKIQLVTINNQITFFLF